KRQGRLRCNPKGGLKPRPPKVAWADGSLLSKDNSDRVHGFQGASGTPFGSSSALLGGKVRPSFGYARGFFARQKAMNSSSRTPPTWAAAPIFKRRLGERRCQILSASSITTVIPTASIATTTESYSSQYRPCTRITRPS